MTGKEREWLEKRIKEVEEKCESYDPSQEELDNLKKRAYEEYSRRVSVREAKKIACKKRTSILRRVATISATVVCLLVISFVYVALAPATISSANNLVRKAVIWINDKMKLGIQFPEPVDDKEARTIDGYMKLDSLEAASQLQIPVFYLKDPRDMKIENISVDTSIDGKQTLGILYSNGSNQLSFLVYPLLEANTIVANGQDFIETVTEVGTIYIAQITNGSRGYLISNGYTVIIESTYSKEALSDLLNTLSVINPQIHS